MKLIFINLFVILTLNSCKGNTNQNEELIFDKVSLKSIEKK